MYRILHPSTQGQAECPPALINMPRWPPSPSGHGFSSHWKAGNQSFEVEGALVRVLLQRVLWLHRPNPQHLTLQKQPRSEFSAAGPGLLSFPPGDPPLPLCLPSWAPQTITAPAWSEEGAAQPHARLGRQAPWGAGGGTVWSGRDSVSCSPFCCPRTQQAGKWSDSGGWARFSAHRQLSVGLPQVLCSLHDFSKAAQPAASPATSHPDLSSWPCQGTSVLTCGNWPPARLCQGISERQTPSSFQHFPKTSSWLHPDSLPWENRAGS